MADKKAETGVPAPSTDRVLVLLTGILEEFKKQVQSRTPPPLTGAALTASELFTQIGAALRLQPLPPIITLIANLREVLPTGETWTLTWTSQFAEKVEITNNFNTAVFTATPVPGGSAPFFVPANLSSPAIFTATAVGLCGSETAVVTVGSDNIP